jgi:GcrA cell cycle regulator
MWTDERVATLKKLWTEGLSASQVARQLGGVTRNAVIGKIHRLGLSGRACPSPPRRARTLRPARPVGRRATPPRPLPPAPAAPRAARPACEAPEGPGAVADLTGLRGHVCKWPIGDPKAPGFSFCGALVEGDGPYCPAHHRRARQPGRLAPLAEDAGLVRLLAA